MAHMYIHHIDITIHFFFLHIFHSFSIGAWLFGCCFFDSTAYICFFLRFFYHSPELGTCFFLRFALALSRSFAELFTLALSRSFFWALNFALLHSRFRAPALLDFSRSFFALLDFSRFFSRSLIFCAHTFAIIDFRARNFVLVRLYTARIG